jgi:integration host factor subunit alpha
MTPKTITREHLYDAVYQSAKLSRAQAATLVELVLEEIAECLERGETVKLSAFGSFIVRRKSQRMGRNPKTGRAAPIPAGRVVVFKPSPVLIKRINGGA